MEHTEAVRLRAVERYNLGELSGDLREQHEEHYFGCSECAEDLKRAAVFVENTRAVLESEPATAAFRAPVVAERKPSSSGWFAGLLRPSFAVPVFALLLLFASYQNLVVIPATIFCYWLGLDHSYLWVITPARVALFKLPPAKEIDPLVQSYRRALQHPLHADLVTISACHGEGVRTYSGEALVGLSRAFLAAGAHAALWGVNDNSTPQLMDHLYSEISKGAPPYVALRDAKLALLHSGTVYGRPFYWARFQFYRGA